MPTAKNVKEKKKAKNYYCKIWYFYSQAERYKNTHEHFLKTLT